MKENWSLQDKEINKKNIGILRKIIIQDIKKASNELWLTKTKEQIVSELEGTINWRFGFRKKMKEEG